MSPETPPEAQSEGLGGFLLQAAVSGAIYGAVMVWLADWSAGLALIVGPAFGLTSTLFARFYEKRPPFSARRNPPPRPE